MRSLLFAAILMFLIPTMCLADTSVSVLTDDVATAVKLRLGMPVGEQWEVGGTATIDITLPEDIWGIGGYVRMDVNPGASIPVKDWIGGLGELLGLPDILEGSTYLIAESQYMHESETIAVAVGPGVQVGPIVAEFLYRIVSGGETDVGGMALASGATLWIGARIEF